MEKVSNYDRLTCEVRVRSKANNRLIRFYGVTGIEIETSFDTLTDTATVTLPHDNNWIKKDTNGFSRFQLISGNDAGYFNVGDEIEIRYGYNFQNNLEFEGYVVGIEPRTPLKLICEDKSWKLKKNRLLFSTRPKVTLREVADKLVAGTGVEIHPLTWQQEIVFGKLYVRNISTAKLLDEWREMGLVSYMLDGKLVIGRSYFNDSTNYNTSLRGNYTPPVFNTEVNITEDKLSINQILAEDIAIRGVSMYTNNKSLQITMVQDPRDPAKLVVAEERDGTLSKAALEASLKRQAAEMEKRGIFLENYTVKTQHEFNLSRAQLIEAVKAAFPKYLRSGMDGTFTTFGDVSLKPATSVYLLDPKNYDKNGEYLIRSIKKTFGARGIRQTVEIPYKIRNIDDRQLLSENRIAVA